MFTRYTKFSWHKGLLLMLILINNYLTTAQQSSLKLSQSNWQQKVNHNITADLNDKTNELQCYQEIVYTNNSPNELKEIWMHVWPNAFSTSKSGFGKEGLISNNKKFLQSKKTDLSKLTNLTFVVTQLNELDNINWENPNAKYEFHEKYNDIIKLILPFTVKPGETFRIYNRFSYKIPALFSRFGLHDGIYSITQWYPKPAVYDINGWNYFPYLDQGEYYSEYGNYTLKITLPNNYRVAATGNLQDSLEKKWLQQLANGDSIVQEASGKKTLTYIADNVHDVAWFACKDWTVKMGKVQLKSGKIVQTYSMEKPTKLNLKTAIIKIGKKSPIHAIKQALEYYSERVGEYPYDYCTAVFGKLPSAGGMEYPMVTICADDNAETVLHEVGHNWFQGMLGNNERQYPWMDESINTFYQFSATDNNFYTEFSPGDKIKINTSKHQFRISQMVGLGQPANMHSNDYLSLNYGAVIYSQMPQHFLYLQEYLGKQLFDSCMHFYFNNWKYKHPLPNDFKSAFETISGKNLDWFFNTLMKGNLPDFALRSAHKVSNGYEIKVANVNGVKVPVKLSWHNGSFTDFLWINGNDTTVLIPENATSVSLNPSGNLTELFFTNNDMFNIKNSVFKNTFDMQLLNPLYRRNVHKVSIIPNFVASNYYDGFSPGLIFTNASIPFKKWQIIAAPMYGLKSNKLVGMAQIKYYSYPVSNTFSLIEFATDYKRFSFRPQEFSAPAYNAIYNHFEPKLTAYFKLKSRKVISLLQFSANINRYDKSGYKYSYYDSVFMTPINAYYNFTNMYQNNIYTILFERENIGKLTFGKISAKAEIGNIIKNSGSYNKLNLNFSKFFAVPIRGLKKVRGIYSNFWATYFNGFNSGYAAISRKKIYGAYLSGVQGNADYAMDQVLRNRNRTIESSSKWNINTSRLLMSTNGMRIPVFIVSDNFSVGSNIDIPTFVMPIQMYFDASFGKASDANMMLLSNGKNVSNKLLYVAGIKYESRLLNNKSFEISLPLFYSKEIPKASKWYSYLSFSINYNLFAPSKIIRNMVTQI